jgi:hypothetical protein
VRGAPRPGHQRSAQHTCRRAGGPSLWRRCKTSTEYSGRAVDNGHYGYLSSNQHNPVNRALNPAGQCLNGASPAMPKCHQSGARRPGSQKRRRYKPCGHRRQRGGRWPCPAAAQASDGQRRPPRGSIRPAYQGHRRAAAARAGQGHQAPGGSVRPLGRDRRRPVATGRHPRRAGRGGPARPTSPGSASTVTTTIPPRASRPCSAPPSQRSGVSPAIRS